MTTPHDHSYIPDLGGRYDFYGPVHKGLRRAQCELLVRMGSTDFSDDRACEQLVAEVRAFIELAAAHLEHEEHHVHPALREQDAGGVQHLDDHHQDHRVSFATLESLLDAVETGEPAAREMLGRRLYLDFSGYVARDFAHMLEEETVAAPQLWSGFADKELMAMESRIVGSLPPEKAMAFMRLMIPAANPAERAALLGGMRQQAPREVFDAVIEFAARPNLSREEFADLADRLALVA